MQEQLLHLFQQHPGLAVFLSLVISVGVAVLGLVPSFFVTAANLLFFGFWPGTALSFAGEALGALVSFVLYRKGFRRRVAPGLDRFPRLQRLLAAEGAEAFGLVFSLRLLPFVPSGLVTFAAAVGRVGIGTFFAASTLGKAPALLLEAWSVYEVTRFGMAGKIILAVVALALLFWILRRLRIGR
ncbi:TVP38/TMEM64 family protein [Flaviaesturariibacter aridisoli]|uniref:TVP38/TMEM64 family membrane protein n=1 Tax=Flaviaesturariibacter aridisoli TaxID=2545761 RepID=A0A4R4E4M1_9BACT|nr:VTT domain-containing protein [Flaviaesturariibacter aridisoli]TCZ72183.1 TVP38/TMEM64 family protein [Flaviaesturariibacter aridisoli]